MKMTLDKFKQLIKEDAIKRVAVQNEIADLEKQKASLLADIKAAELAGDVDAYRAKKKELADVSEVLHVKRTYLDNAKLPVTEDDARAIWDSFTGKYDKDMEKAISDFVSLREKLVAAYLNMVNMQNEACRTREDLCDVLGISNPDRAFPMQYIPVQKGVDALGLIKKSNMQIQDPDFVYVAACMEIKAGRFLQLDPSTDEAKEMDRAYSVVSNHRSK